MTNYQNAPILPQGLVISKIILLQTERNYDGIYKRNYMLNVKSEDLTTFNDIVANNPCGVAFKIPQATLANRLPGIVTYSPNASRVAIPHGWSTRRCIFFLVVDDTTTFQTYIIQGYTDYDDPSMNRQPDPNMVFYINTIHSFLRKTNQFNQPFLVHNYSYNVIVNKESTNLLGYGNDFAPNEILVRPFDVYIGLTGKTLYESNPYSGHTINQSAWYDGEAKTSFLRNNDPIHYLDHTINSYITSKNAADADNDLSEIYSNAASNITEQSLFLNPFIRAISLLNGVNVSTTFKMDDLALIDSDLTNKNVQSARLHYFLAGDADYQYNVIKNPLFDTASGESHLQVKLENYIANRVISSITSYIAESAIKSVDVSFTNNSLTGEGVVVVTTPVSILDSVDGRVFKPIIQSKVETYVVPYVMSYGIPVTFHCIVDLFIDSVIKISINNQPEIVYIFPTFANGLFNPVISDKTGYSNMVQDVDILTDCISDTRDKFLTGSSVSVMPPVPATNYVQRSENGQADRLL